MSAETNKVIRILDSQTVKDDENRRLLVRKNAQQSLLYLSEHIANYNQRFYSKKGDGTVHKKPGGSGLTLFTGRLQALRKVGTVEPMVADNSHEALSTGGASAHLLPGGKFGWRSGYANITPIISGARAEPGPPALGKSSPDLAISRLTGLSGDVEKFFTFELTSAQMASLVPKIQIYKLDYKLFAKGDPDGEEGTVDHSKKPTRREIVFEKAITKDQLERDSFGILERDGNLGGSGIKSFRWALKGVNPAEVDSNIEATLEVYFNNIGVFQDILDNLDLGGTTPGSATSAASFLDLITFAPPTLKDSKNLPCIEDYDESFFEIEIVVGWDTAPDSTSFNSLELEHINEQTTSLFLTLTDHKFDFKEDGSATLEVNYRARSTMNGRKYDMFESPANSKLGAAKKAVADAGGELEDAQSAGTTNLTAEQKLLDESEETLYDVLKMQHRKLVAQFIRSAYVAKIPSQLLLNGFTVEGGTGAAANADDALGAPKEATGVLTWKQLGDILTSQAAGADYANLKTGVIDPVQAAVRELAGATTKIVVTRRVQGNYDFNAIDIADDLVMDPDTEDTDTANTDVLDQADAAGLADSGAGTFNTINFLYLGDILETILEWQPKILSDIMYKKFALATMDFKFINYFKLVEKMNPVLKTVAGHSLAKLSCKQAQMTSAQKKDLYSSINLANIPINLELFLDFLTEKIISPQRSVYYFEDFLHDLFNTLVKPILADPGVFGSRPTMPVMININVDTSNKGTFFNGKHLGNYDQPDTKLINPDDIAVSIWRGEIKSAARWSGAARKYNFINSIDTYRNNSPVGGASGPPQIVMKPSKTEDSATIKIIGINLHVDNFKGDYDKNIKSSISNFIVGLDRGVVKSVSFERVDQAYLRESRTATSKNFGTGQLRELYHVNLKLYGNNLLKPGQIIYVEPNSLIFGRPSDKKSAARILGLGGYHLVVDVSNEISQDGWETSVKALHMAMPAEDTTSVTQNITSATPAATP